MLPQPAAGQQGQGRAVVALTSSTSTRVFAEVHELRLWPESGSLTGTPCRPRSRQADRTAVHRVFVEIHELHLWPESGSLTGTP
jgi:hypothetical protein